MYNEFGAFDLKAFGQSALDTAVVGAGVGAGIAAASYVHSEVEKFNVKKNADGTVDTYVPDWVVDLVPLAGAVVTQTLVSQKVSRGTPAGAKLYDAGIGAAAGMAAFSVIRLFKGQAKKSTSQTLKDVAAKINFGAIPDFSVNRYLRGAPMSSEFASAPMSVRRVSGLRGLDTNPRSRDAATLV